MDRPLGPVIRDLTRRSSHDITRWLRQVDRLNGCREPIRLIGESATIHTHTGELLSHYTTTDEPHGQLLARCGNRRTSRCPACAETYRSDTFHLIRAGLLGGDKGVPSTVRTHPRVLATLTAPTFGPVHQGPAKDGTSPLCHPRRTGSSCFTRHQEGDPAIGQPLDPDTYDYIGHVLWNAHAGDLWRRFTIYLRRHLAAAAGLTRKTFNETVRISFAKVAEYQARGVVHFHAVIRLDSRTDDNTPVPPPAWATSELLDDAIHSAARAVRLPAPDLGQPTRHLVWGDQIDVKHIHAAAEDDGKMTEEKVAGYIAKYATKAAETSGTLDRPLTHATIHQLARLGIADHPARLIRTAWALGNPTAHPDLAHLRLRDWAHMLASEATSRPRAAPTPPPSATSARPASTGPAHDCPMSPRRPSSSVTGSEGDDTKTKKSRRTLAMPRRCVDALKLHRERQDVAKKAAGDRWQDNDLVFASKVGTELDAHNVRRSFRAVLRKAGLDPKNWTPREMRHSFVSLLSDSGMPIEAISRLVGHRNTTVTETVYRKQLRPVLLEGAEAMDRIFDPGQ